MPVTISWPTVGALAICVGGFLALEKLDQPTAARIVGAVGALGAAVLTDMIRAKAAPQKPPMA